MKAINATSDDIWIIQTLAGETWPHTFKELLSEEQIAYMMDMMYSTGSLHEQITRLNHHYILAKEDDEYFGYLSYELNYKGKELTKIHKVYIRPAAQGKGVGRFLFDHVSHIAASSGDKGLTLNVNRYNKAIEFYKRYGFGITGSEDIEIGNGFLMEDYILDRIF